MIFTLVYVSFATTSWDRPQLEALLRASREHNARRDVTGMLLYKDRSFVQLLEGAEDTVRELYDVIAADPRHEEIITVWTGFDDRRRFPDWSMGFTDLDQPPAELAGYTNFLEAPLGRREPAPANLGVELLDLFRRIR